jgi:phosphatidylserine synthase
MSNLRERTLAKADLISFGLAPANLLVGVSAKRFSRL